MYQNRSTYHKPPRPGSRPARLTASSRLIETRAARGDTMRIGISLTSNHPDAKDPRQGARWMIERAAAAHRSGLEFAVRRRSARLAHTLLSEHADARAAARGVGRGPGRMPVPAPVVAPGSGGRADRDTGGHRSGFLHHAVRARLGRGPVRRYGRQHQDASFGFRGSSRHCPAPAGGRNGEFPVAVPDRRSEPGAASGRARRGVDRRQRPAGHRPRGATGGGLDCEPQPHPRRGARPGRSLS